MNNDNLYIVQQKINELVKGNVRFALYKLPNDKLCHFVLQTSENTPKYNKVKNLKDIKGFVIAPFSTNKKTPIVLIKPDITKDGWGEISNFLATYSFLPNTTEKPAFTPDNSTKNKYLYDFNTFVSNIRSLSFSKLVLARSYKQTLSEDFLVSKTFTNACNKYPHEMTYLYHTPETGTWLGSTPEILLSGTSDVYHTVALAGTKKIEDRINGWDDKNQNEQKIVYEYIKDTIKHYGKILLKSEPCTIEAGHLIHIKTDIYFKLHSRFSIGDILNALHPTPAVCGYPKNEALNFILKKEQTNRYYFSGFIGWIDSENLSNIYVNLRCMNIWSKEAILYAGGGILASSTALSEWDETEEKMKTMKNLL